MPRADRIVGIVAVALLLGWAAPRADAGAPASEAQPVDIQADFGEIDRVAGRGVYRGNVVIQQGGMRITAAEVRIILEDDELARVEIDGAPATFEHLPPGSTQPTRGMARSMVYEVKASTVELRGEARVEQRGDEVAGESIRYDLKDDRVLAASGQGSNERVQMTITPRRAKDGEAKKPAATEPPRK
jgi:lipopolysaccharide export system protein LptA